MKRKVMLISAICGLALALPGVQAGDRGHAGHKGVSMERDREMQDMQGFAEDRGTIQGGSIQGGDVQSGRMEGGARGGIGASRRSRDLRMDTSTDVDRDRGVRGFAEGDLDVDRDLRSDRDIGTRSRVGVDSRMDRDIGTGMDREPVGGGASTTTRDIERGSAGISSESNVNSGSGTGPNL